VPVPVPVLVPVPVVPGTGNLKLPKFEIFEKTAFFTFQKKKSK
jgi:hypothetical protein